jgi:BolA family transcriptional regulator, general stress-responsive regulator
VSLEPEIRRRLETLSPTSLHIEDESAQHAGHAGAKDGGGHYRLTIVSSSFHGLNAVARHRLVYQNLGDLMQKGIHALAINAFTPEEF